MKTTYATAKAAYLAVLAALAKLDPQKEGVGRIRIWRFSPVAKSGSPFGWSISVVREVSWDNSAPPDAWNWTAPAARSLTDCDRDRHRWNEMALAAWEEAEARERAEAGLAAGEDPSE